MPTSTSSITSMNSVGGTGVLQTNQASYGDNPFLKLLTSQLQNQTPLEPVDNASFMNQMASYTTMTEQRDLNSNMLKLLDYQGVLARVQGLGQGSALLGKEVSYAGAEGKPAAGTVESTTPDMAATSALGVLTLGPWLGHASWHAYSGSVR